VIADERSGQTNLDLTISVPPTMTVRESHAVEQRVREAVMSARKEIREVKIHVHGQEAGETEFVDDGDSKVIRSDFGDKGC
jgi:divalent metal cation (Fe/Co/Zn/Cd) transporter